MHIHILLHAFQQKDGKKTPTNWQSPEFYYNTQVFGSLFNFFVFYIALSNTKLNL